MSIELTPEEEAAICALYPTPVPGVPKFTG
jgi:hypothetical protein